MIEKKKAGPLEPRVTITEKVFRTIEQNPHKAPYGTREEIKRLARHYRFFHWHIAFPNVFQVPGPDEEPDDPQMGWSGGFDLVLGNPPWDSMSPDAKEFFSTYDPLVRFQDREGQARIIDCLLENPVIAREWQTYCRDLYAQAHLFKESGRFPPFCPRQPRARATSTCSACSWRRPSKCPGREAGRRRSCRRGSTTGPTRWPFARNSSTRST